MDTLRGVRTADSLPPGQVARVGDLVVDQLLGIWYATDLEADGLVQLVLAAADGQLSVRAFGADSPEPQDWGEVPAEAFGATVTASTAMAFSAVYRFDFLTVVVAAYGKQGILVVDTFNTFTDSSGRSNYFSREFFPPVSANEMTPVRTARRRDRLDAPGGSAAIDVRPLLGAWQSYDIDTSGILRLDIASRHGELVLTPHSRETAGVDWGNITAAAFAIGVTGDEAVGFLAECQRGPASVVLAAYLNKRLLVVDTYTRFTDTVAGANHFQRDHLYTVSQTTR